MAGFFASISVEAAKRGGSATAFSVLQVWWTIANGPQVGTSFWKENRLGTPRLLLISARSRWCCCCSLLHEIDDLHTLSVTHQSPSFVHPVRTHTSPYAVPGDATLSCQSAPRFGNSVRRNRSGARCLPSHAPLRYQASHAHLRRQEKQRHNGQRTPDTRATAVHARHRPRRPRQLR